MKILEFPQYSEEWFATRAGVPSASNFDKIITTKGERSKSAQKYMYQLAGEKIIGKSEEGYTNAAMERGLQLEDEARKLYELTQDVEVKQVGFCITEGEYVVGCSPDGMIGVNGLLEIKCPTLPVHVEYLLKGDLPTEYFQQVQGQLFVTGYEYCDFISYYPGLDPLIKRIYPDKEFHKKLKVELNIFCIELEEVIKKLRR